MKKGFIRGLIIGAVAMGALLCSIDAFKDYRAERACSQERNVHKCVSIVVWQPADIKIALEALK
jgi:hypothetical protein